MDRLKKNLPAQAGEGSPELAVRQDWAQGFTQVSIVAEGCLDGFAFCQLRAQAEATVCALTEVPQVGACNMVPARKKQAGDTES